MQKLFTIAVISFIALSAASAQAEQRWPNWYLGLSGSLSWLPDADIDGPGINAEVAYNTGWGAGASIGYMPNADIPFFNRMRYELEVYYRSADIDRCQGVAATGFDNVNSITYMANAIYDFDTGTQFVPYLGAGVGMSNVEFGSDEDMVFSYQFITGIGYEPTLIPNTVWSIGYRYFGTEDANISAAPVRFKLEHNAHNVEAGLRMKF